jgi:predicted double-glycine peptidase
VNRALLWAVAAGGVCVSGCGPLFTSAGPASLVKDEGWWVTPQVELVRQRGAYDCGPAALASLLTRWEPRDPAPGVRAVLGPGHANGVQAGELRAFVRARELRAFVIQGTVEDLAFELWHRRPVLVGLVEYSGKRAYGHYAVVVGLRRDRSRVLLADPARGWRNIPVSAFELEWAPTGRLSMVVLPAQPAT